MNYTVVVENSEGVLINETNTSFVVLYNGNLGKDFEYPNANPTLREFTVTGDVIVLTQSDSTYMKGSDTNRTDVFDVALNGNVVSDALLYVSYNWDKIVNGDFNTWITTFNGQSIAPVASYRDQANLGNYGKYGYGLVVYNVTGLLVDGENTFVLNKTNGNVAVYPSTLIVLTDAENSTVEKTVYILEEADLLSKTNNKNLDAGFNTTFDVIDGNATLYVFAASAQSGEGNLIINGETNTDIWNGTSNSVEAFIANVSSGNIKIYFESIGATILALQQMVVVENIIPEVIKQNATIVIDAPEITEGENATITVTIENATGDVTITVGNITKTDLLNGGKVIFVIPDLSKGNYIIDVTYAGDDNFNNATANSTLTVNAKEEPVPSKENATMTVSAEPITEGENATVVVVLPDDATGNVTVGDTTVPVVNGTASVSVSGLAVGNNTLPVVYSGDDKYNPAEDNVTVTVNSKEKVDSNINVSADNISEGEVANVIVLLPGSATGNVTVILNGESKVININDTTVRGLNGVLSMLVTYNDLGVGNYTVVAIYSGDDKFNPSNATTTFEVAKASKENATMTVSAEPITEGENATVSVTLPKDATGNVTATVDGKTYTAPVKDGKATLDIPALAAGNYTIPVTYSGDDKYNPVTKDIEVSVEEKKSDIILAPDVTKYFKGSERFIVNVTDYQGNPLANRSVSIVINGVKYDRTTKADGTTSIALELNSGVYNVTVIVGNETVNSVVTVLSTVNGTDVVKVFRNATQYYATFRDSEGNYLKEGTVVTFNINGVMYERKISGSEGLAKLNLNLEQGTYVLTAINPVTGEMGSNNITIISRLVENKDITKYYRNATQYTVKVLGDDGNPVGAGESVTFNINGVFYTRTTDASGIAKLNLNLDYIITAEYKDCRVSNKIKVLPVLSAKDISMKYRDGTKFVATLVDGQGKPFAGETIQFNINGVFYNRVTDSNGQAKLNINLQAGQYIITSSYNGANIANTITISA